VYSRTSDLPKDEKVNAFIILIERSTLLKAKLCHSKTRNHESWTVVQGSWQINGVIAACRL